MADSDSKLAEQLEILNKNLSTESLKTNFHNPNFAEYLCTTLEELTRQIHNLAVNVSTLNNKVDGIIKPNS